MPEHEISYGKSGVRVYRVGPGNSLFAAEVDVDVFGDNFLRAYTEGDNTNVVATDSIKNFVLRHGQAYHGGTLEGFCDTLGRGLLARYGQMESLRVCGRELRFDHERGALFSGSRDDRGVAELEHVRAGEEVRIAGHRCGRVGLRLWKLRGSAFTHFVRDEYTTLPERRDRPLYIELDVYWSYADVHDAVGEGECHVPSAGVRDVVVDVFDAFVSESIQHLVHQMGRVVLDRYAELAEVSFEAQNRTCDPLFEYTGDEDVRSFADPFPAYGTVRLRLRRSYTTRGGS